MPASAVRSQPLDAAAVLALQSVRGYPCISLLLTTTPGERATDADRGTLEALAAQARRRVREEAPPQGEAALTRLDEAVTGVAGRPTMSGMGFFVNPDVAEVVDLPIDVPTRCVVDPTFATRDLVRALHRTPRHVLVVLTPEEARIVDGALGALSPATSVPAPAGAPGTDGETARSGYLADVDRVLGTYLRLRPAPVLLAGDEALVTQFTTVSTNLARLAGAIPGDHCDTPLDDLAGLARPLIEGYLLSREAEAMELLSRRSRQDRAMLGIDACWTAARWRRPEMLAVEEGFFYPAWISDDGDELTATNDPTEMGAIDDVVDELIEGVLTRGGWVALVQDGIIPDGARVALTVR